MSEICTLDIGREVDRPLIEGREAVIDYIKSHHFLGMVELFEQTSPSLNIFSDVRVFFEQFDPLQLHSNAWWEATRMASAQSHFKQLASFHQGLGSLNSIYVRNVFVETLSFSIPTEESIDAIKQFAGDTPIKEYLAGTGYWAYHLRNAGVSITCSDINRANSILGSGQCFVPIETEDASEAEPPADHIIMLSWIPYREADVLLSRFRSGQKLILIGERECCGSLETYELLETDFQRIGSSHLCRFFGMHDTMQFYQKI